MSVTKAIILAAGSGSRLCPHTSDRPKCLLEVGGRTLIDHQLSALSQCGITDVVAVVGYRDDRIRKHLGNCIRYVMNERYQSTNSVYSLWLASAELEAGALILNSDVFAPPKMFENLVVSPAADAILVELGESFEAEDMKVMLNGSLVTDFGKDLPPERTHAHNVGVAKFSAQGAVRLTGCLDELIAAGHEGDWAPRAFREFARHWPLTAVATDGLPWIEIDYPEDLMRARHEIDPAMHGLDSTVAVR